MKKLFLTSGLVLCMACPAFATDVSGSGNECVNDVLGVYSGSATIKAKWSPNISGAIALDSKKYSANDSTSGVSSTDCGSLTTATPTPLYSVYNYGIYSTQPTSSNYTTATQLTALTRNPSLPGYTFLGFYTTKASSGTQVINSSGTVLDAAKTNVSTTGGTTTWYARYRPNISGAIGLDSGYYSSSSASSATYTPTTSAAPSSLWSAYEYSMYKTEQPTASNYTAATNKITALTTVPSGITGYTFQGFYTGKHGSGTKVTNSSGTFETAATKQVCSNNGTGTWYAHWTPNCYGAVTLDGKRYSSSSDTTGTAASNAASATSSVYVQYDNSSTLYTTNSCGTAATVTLPTRDYYTFTGFYDTKAHAVASADGSTTTGQMMTPSKTLTTAGKHITAASTWIAGWSPNCYGGITLNSNIYTNSSDSTAKYSVTSSPTSLYVKYGIGFYSSNTCGTAQTVTAPSQTGYTFKGYYTDKTGIGGTPSGTKMINADGTATDSGKTAHAEATWYANWAANKYNVVYNKGTCGGSAYTHTNGATYDVNYTILGRDSTTVTIPTGYVWDGWTTASTPTYNSNTLQNVAANLTPWNRTSALNLYGACTPAIGTITLNSDLYVNGTKKRTAGTAAATTPLYSAYGTVITTTKPTRANYASSTAYTQLTTLPVLTGYTFGGFYTTKGGTGTVLINSSGAIQDAAKTQITTDNGSATFWAKWTAKKYTVTYNSGPCETTAKNVYTHTDGATYDSNYTVASDANTAMAGSSVTIKTGRTFVGWSASNNNSLETADFPDTDATPWTRDGNLTVYGVCKYNRTTVNYSCGTKPEGASGTFTSTAPAAGTAKYGSSFTFANPTSSQCKLPGWTGKWSCTGASGTSGLTAAPTFGQTVSSWAYTGADGGSVSCTATWTANQRTVTYSCGTALSGLTLASGSTPPAASTFTYDGTYTLPTSAPNCTMNGAHFIGWKCSKTLNTGADYSGTTANYAGTCASNDPNSCPLSSSTKTGTFKTDANVTCTAMWAYNTISLTWNDNGATTAHTGGGSTCTYNSGITIPTAEPVKNGWHFTGWTVQ